MPSLLEMLIALFTPGTTDTVAIFWAKHLLLATLVVGSFWLLSQAVAYIISHWASRLTSFTRTDLDDRILKRLAPSISLLITLTGVYLALRTLPLPEKLLAASAGGLFIINVVIICVMLYRTLNETLLWYVERSQDQGDGKFARQMVPMAEKIVMLFIIGAALIVVLKHFHYDILSLVTALGIGSLAIGMAAKDTLSHVISGFTLMIDRPFQIGDRIKLGSGQIGDVVDIGLRSTKIQGLDTTVMIIPNSDLCNSTVINMVRPTSVIQGRTTVGVGYDSDVDQVKRVLLEIARNCDEVLEEPAPLALFTSFGDSALTMLLLFWINDPTRLGAVTDQINSAIIRRFREERIEIPFPIRTVQIQATESTIPAAQRAS